MGMMDAPAGGPQTQQKPKQPALTGGMMANPTAGQQTTGQQEQTDGTGGGQQAQPGQPSQGWGVDWNNPWYKGGPALTMPQSVQDWGAVAGNEAAMGLPGLKAQADALAARQRLGPVAAATADLAGNALSPTTFLTALPGGAPIAGALHEGVKSYMSQPNWIPDAQARTKIADDAAAGALWGQAGRAAAAAAPVVAPVLSRVAVQGGIPSAAAWAGHMLFGHGDLYREIVHMGPEFASIFALDEAGKKAAEVTKNALSSPAARQAIQNLILSGGSAARTAAGPYDQWIPGQ